MQEAYFVLFFLFHLGFSVWFVYDYEIENLKERPYNDTYLADSQNEPEYMTTDHNDASTQTKRKELENEKKKEEEKEKHLLKVLMRLKKNA
jgi:hypothetical protein